MECDDAFWERVLFELYCLKPDDNDPDASTWTAFQTAIENIDGYPLSRTLLWWCVDMLTTEELNSVCYLGTQEPSDACDLFECPYLGSDLYFDQTRDPYRQGSGGTWNWEWGIDPLTIDQTWEGTGAWQALDQKLPVTLNGTITQFKIRLTGNAAFRDWYWPNCPDATYWHEIRRLWNCSSGEWVNIYARELVAGGVEQEYRPSPGLAGCLWFDMHEGRKCPANTSTYYNYVWKMEIVEVNYERVKA